jgi:hypothetical protein
MNRLEVPLLRRFLRATGQTLLRAELELWLRDAQNVLQTATFRIDSASEMTTMPASTASRLGLPMPSRPVPNLIHAQSGLEIRDGFLRAQVNGLDGTEYFFPCFFLGDPAAAAPPGPGAQFPHNLLGLTGVVDKIRIVFDGTPTPLAGHGVMIIEKT